MCAGIYYLLLLLFHLVFVFIRWHFQCSKVVCWCLTEATLYRNVRFVIYLFLSFESKCARTPPILRLPYRWINLFWIKWSYDINVRMKIWFLADKCAPARRREWVCERAWMNPNETKRNVSLVGGNTSGQTDGREERTFSSADFFDVCVSLCRVLCTKATAAHFAHTSHHNSHTVQRSWLFGLCLCCALNIWYVFSEWI